MKAATVGGMVEAYLRAEHYEGLFNADGECACLVGDLSPARCMVEECCAGILVPCPQECGDHAWHIAPRPEQKQQKGET